MVEMAGRERSGEDLQKFRDRIEAVGGGNTAYALLLGLEPADNAALVARVEEGFLYRALERLRSNVGLSREALADLVQIKPRTLDRRKEGGRLRPEESDRLLRAARVFGGTIALFEGDADAARAWLSSPQRALGGAVPLEMARTEVGAREVESLVGRLEHGVFS